MAGFSVIPSRFAFSFFFLPFSVQSARKLSNARVLLTQRSQEVNYSRLRRHHGGGGEKEKTTHRTIGSHYGGSKDVLELVFLAPTGAEWGLRRGVRWRTKHKRISQELRCLLEGRICFHS